LFETPKDFHQASCRRAALLREPAYRAVPELVKAMEQFDEAKFAKLMAYLDGPGHRRVRTNNHVERANRMFRFLEKVRYKWRRRMTLVRFIVMKLDAIWSDQPPPEAKAEATPRPKQGKQRKPQRNDGLQPRQVA